MNELLKKYGFDPSKEAIENELKEILNGTGPGTGVAANATKDNITKCLASIDLTSLHTSDTHPFITAFTEKVNTFKKDYPQYPLPASICVFPNFAKTVKAALKAEGVGITTVAACFPSSQSFLDVKYLECQHAIEDGATEVDIVLPHSYFMAGEYDKVRDEFIHLRKVTEGKHLKVILESGALQTEGEKAGLNPVELIATASFIALECGADFIKTSTGKQNPAATPLAAIVMCKCLKYFYQITGQKRGFKPAGGISTTEDALVYLTIVKSVLGPGWLNPLLFRIGASSLANNLLTTLECRTVKYF